MTERQYSSRLSRRDFLRLAGLGLGATLIGVGPGRGLLQNPGVRVARAAGRSGTLRVGWTTPKRLDPAQFTDAPDVSIGKAVYDYLVVPNQKLQILPGSGLAKSWEVSPDGKTYTFKLSEGVKFHDGSDFSAKDVKFTFDRLRDPAVKSPAASLYTEVDKIEVVDATTVRFVLKNPVGAFLSFLADYHAAILKDGTTKPEEAFNGTGPFKKVSIDTSSGASFEANSNYWRPGEPKVEKLEMIFVNSINDLIPTLQGGQLDFLPRLDANQYTTLGASANVVAVPTNGFSYIRLRADQGPGKDVKVRQAFRLAIDRAALNKALTEGLGSVGRDSPIGPLYGDLYSEATPFPKRDVEAAKKLLAEAGYKDGLQIELVYPPDEEGSTQIAQILRSQLKEVGVDVTLNGFAKYYDDVPNNWLEANFAITFWASRPDPQTYLDLMLHSGSKGSDLGKWNEAHVADADLDKNIDAARIEPDPKKRAGYTAEIQRILIERGSAYITFFKPNLAALSKRVKGIELAPDAGMTTFSTAEISG